MTTPSRPSKPADGRPGAPRPIDRPVGAPAPVDGGSKTRELLVSAPKLETPKGGGAVKGIGEKFQANPVTGTSGLTIPLPLSPGRNEFTPSLSLSYDSGSGNGPFGLGWTLSVPRVCRKTDKGLPTYRDRDDDDTFVMPDAEDLVPAQAQVGDTWTDITDTRTEDATTYTVRRYRPRTEGAYALIERWTNAATNEAHWRTRTRENVLRIFGRTSTARLADPDHPTKVFCWYLEEERDEVGNVIVYAYDGHERDATETGLHASNRGSVAWTYLKRVAYGNATPSNPSLFHFELVFDYGDHTASPPAPIPDTSTCPVREDPFSQYRPGFETRCVRLCTRAMLFHRFPTGASGA